jgi:hypothetical protein
MATSPNHPTPEPTQDPQELYEQRELLRVTLDCIADAVKSDT